MTLSVLFSLVEFMRFWIVSAWIVAKTIFRAFFAQEKSVDGEIILITGAGHGLGRELAVRYANLGAIVVCWDINERQNNETVQMIRDNGNEAFGYVVDVTDRKKVFETAEKIRAEVGEVTILYNNAGVAHIHEFLELTESEVVKCFNINIISHFWTLQAFLPSMIARNYGQVVAICSLAGINGMQMLTSYSATKFAVSGLQESLREELRITSKGQSKIKFTTIYPTFVRTGFFEKDSLRIRHESLLPIITTDEAVTAIVSAQRMDLDDATVPRSYMLCNKLTKLLPNDAFALARDFIGTEIDSDKQKK